MIAIAEPPSIIKSTPENYCVVRKEVLSFILANSLICLIVYVAIKHDQKV